MHIFKKEIVIMNYLFTVLFDIDNIGSKEQKKSFRRYSGFSSL